MRVVFLILAAALTFLPLPVVAQVWPGRGRIAGPYPDALRGPSDVRVGSEAATPERLQGLITDLGAGSGLYGTDIPVPSRGDRAAVELVRIGRPGVPALMQVVQDVRTDDVPYGERANRRWFAVQILGRIGDRRAEPVLVDCLRREPVSAVRAYAPCALERLHDPRAEPALQDGLADTFPDVRQNAAHALGALLSARAVPALISLLADPPGMAAFPEGAARNLQDADVVWGPPAVSPASAAALALAQIGAPAVKPLRTALADPRTHRFAAVGLAFSASRQTDADVRGLLRDPDPEVRVAAARGEVARHDGGAVPPLAAALHDPDGRVRLAAGQALAESGGVAGVRALLDTAHGADPTARAVAIEALRSVRDRRAADLLLAEVVHGQGRARWSAAEALLPWHDPRATVPTLRLLDDPDPAFRADAVWLINQLRDTRAFPALVRATEDPDEKVRIMATESIEDRKSDPIVPPLLRRLHDPSEMVRLYAIYGLGATGDRAAVAPLRSLLGHDTDRVQDAAQKALVAIGAAGPASH
ncbi:MAG: HEAT repeat domain-containing protein [Armatimonadetes bacterium]|nr:HEAT repeat domain-containing protein [Armatimonadota bacterium]